MRDVALDFAAALDAGYLMQSAGLDPPEGWQRDVLLSPAKFLAVLCPRQVGKSTITAAAVLNYAMYRPGSIVLLASPTKRQSDLLFEKVLDIFHALPQRPTGARAIAGRLELPNGSRVISLPGNERTIRGLSADFIVIDEAAQTSDELFNAVVPMIAARDGRIILLSTPYGQRGFFYKACTDRRLGWNIITIKAEQSARLSPQTLQSLRQTMNPIAFRQEYLCEFLGDSSRYFPAELIEAAIDPNIEPF